MATNADQHERPIQNWILLAVLIVAVLFGGYTLFWRTTPFERGQDAGRIEVAREDINEYFVFVSADTARSLLVDAREEGRFVFLFPQVELDNIERLIIEEREVRTAAGERVAMLGVEGLPAGSRIYSNVDGTVRASVVEYEDETQPLVIFTGESSDATSEFYVPYVPGANDIPEELRGVAEVTFGTPLVGIAEGAYLNHGVFPETWQMALVIQSIQEKGAGSADEGTLQNVLTRFGKIVMVR